MFAAADDALDVVKDYVSGSAAEDYAGHYIAPATEVDGGLEPAGQVIVVLFTANLEAHTRFLNEHFPFPEFLRVMTGELMMEELATLRDRIMDDRDELRGLGVVVSGVGRDVSTNSVRVWVQGEAEPALRVLQDRYGPHITTRTGWFKPALLLLTVPVGVGGQTTRD